MLAATLVLAGCGSDPATVQEQTTKTDASKLPPSITAPVASSNGTPAYTDDSLYGAWMTDGTFDGDHTFTKLIGKRIDVTGHVSVVQKRPGSGDLISLGQMRGDAHVTCIFDGTQKLGVKAVTIGDFVSVRGTLRGSRLGTGITLTNCEFQN